MNISVVALFKSATNQIKVKGQNKDLKFKERIHISSNCILHVVKQEGKIEH